MSLDAKVQSRAQRAELARAVEAIEQQVTSKLKIEREIAAEKAQRNASSELESRIRPSRSPPAGTPRARQQTC